MLRFLFGRRRSRFDAAVEAEVARRIETVRRAGMREGWLRGWADHEAAIKTLYSSYMKSGLKMRLQDADQVKVNPYA